MDYYTKTIYIPHVDENDNVIGKVERWKAHREGILHRGLTVGIYFEDKIICQHRKHPVFNGFLDLTASTHPQYMDNKIQSVEDATIQTLKREWNIEEKEIHDLKVKGKVVYNSKFQEYIEHEVCYLLTAQVKAMPTVNLEYAYGSLLLAPKELHSHAFDPQISIAPWVEEFFRNTLL